MKGALSNVKRTPRHPLPIAPGVPRCRLKGGDGSESPEVATLRGRFWPFGTAHDPCAYTPTST